MYLINRNHKFHYEMENLLRVFFPEKITVTDKIPEGEDYVITELNDGIKVSAVIGNEIFEDTYVYDETDSAETERLMAITMFNLLSEYTGYTPPWGILTGVRPAKLMTNLIKEMGEEEAVIYFSEKLLVSEEKTKLALLVSKAENPIISSASAPDSYSLYISIPFCPTRCSYCSFISHSNESAKKLIPDYVEKLCEELKVTGDIAKELKLRLESVYIGGGTPTVLSASQLKKITDCVSANFDLTVIREYTIEAGRPDSITADKFDVIKESGCTRISINPQTFNDDVLREIGRQHSAQMTIDAFNLARDKKFGNINMDLIAGLPTDTLESFENTLSKTIDLSPENITVHTLSLKRSSNIVTENRRTNSGELASEMLELCQKRLTEAGYVPYYMYRQSKCLGNLENVGWAKKGYEGLYNVYMMEECHTVLSVGAGAVIKLKKPDSNEIERIFNYKYPYEYISGFEEILKRKEYIYGFYSKSAMTGGI
ncbi:MAG: coproporphyrinogen dehydrogenase HemZ [Acutalibacteraceae bacterium]|nr:coproporphyrinogen dehydrogenase HemZ [Acutalibacteraceae bacterium]